MKKLDKLKFPDHNGKATWGERLVPLDEFRKMAAASGRELSAAERREARDAFVATIGDEQPSEGPFDRIIVFGGVYNNHHALEALLEEAERRRAEAVYCLGDLGGFGPNPEKVLPLLRQGNVRSIQGNYEESLSGGAEDCNCGYTDPRDNHFAALSYDYTAAHTSDAFKHYMGDLPLRRRVRVGKRELLLVHGSPRRINEFLFRSSTAAAYLEVLLDQNACHGILCTHTGLHWHRRLPSGRDAINVGVIGRPANDGRTDVWFCELEARDNDLVTSLVPLSYDHRGLAEEMRAERLPEDFIETILTGHWTTCLEVLPPKERAASKF